MITYNNPYSQKVYIILIPLVGDFMARSILKTQTAKLGLTEDKLTKKDLPNLAEGIRKGLMAFIGSNGAAQISSKIASLT
jgi:hypothetical protein